MQKQRKTLMGLGIVLLFIISLYPCFLLYLWLAFPSPEIVDFKPTTFTARAEHPFFYKIGYELRYADTIDKAIPPRTRGEIGFGLVSPDGKSLAVVVDDILKVVSGNEGTVQDVAEVASIYWVEHKGNQSFYRDDRFQWSRDGKSLFLVKDWFVNSRGRRYSADSELWKYDLDTGQMTQIIKPFRGEQFFFGKKGIYYSTTVGNGNLQLRYFDGNDSYRICERMNGCDELLPDAREDLFYTFTYLDMTYNSQPKPSVALDVLGDCYNDEIATLFINRHEIFSFAPGKDLKGSVCFHPDSMLAELPGARYVLLSLDRVKQQGSVLVDSTTGKYMHFEDKVYVYSLFNTNILHQFQVDDTGIELRP